MEQNDLFFLLWWPLCKFNILFWGRICWFESNWIPDFAIFHLYFWSLVFSFNSFISFESSVPTHMSLTFSFFFFKGNNFANNYPGTKYYTIQVQEVQNWVFLYSFSISFSGLAYIIFVSLDQMFFLCFFISVQWSVVSVKFI